MTLILKNKHTLIVKDFYFKCCVGKYGLSKKKREGDKKTPRGIFKIDKLYYRKDRLPKPLTKLKCMQIKKDMGWCDDIKSKQHYNKLIKINKNFSHWLKTGNPDFIGYRTRTLFAIAPRSCRRSFLFFSAFFNIIGCRIIYDIFIGRKQFSANEIYIFLISDQ